MAESQSRVSATATASPLQGCGAPCWRWQSETTHQNPGKIKTLNMETCPPLPICPAQSSGFLAPARQGKGARQTSLVIPSSADIFWSHEASILSNFLVLLMWRSTVWLKAPWKQQKDLSEAGKASGLNLLFSWHWCYGGNETKAGSDWCWDLQMSNPSPGISPLEKFLCVQKMQISLEWDNMLLWWMNIPWPAFFFTLLEKKTTKNKQASKLKTCKYLFGGIYKIKKELNWGLRPAIFNISWRTATLGILGLLSALHDRAMHFFIFFFF